MNAAASALSFPAKVATFACGRSGGKAKLYVDPPFGVGVEAHRIFGVVASPWASVLIAKCSVCSAALASLEAFDAGEVRERGEPDRVSVARRLFGVEGPLKSTLGALLAPRFKGKGVP